MFTISSIQTCLRPKAQMWKNSKKQRFSAKTMCTLWPLEMIGQFIFIPSYSNFLSPFQLLHKYIYFLLRVEIFSARQTWHGRIDKKKGCNSLGSTEVSCILHYIYKYIWRWTQRRHLPKVRRKTRIAGHQCWTKNRMKLFVVIFFSPLFVFFFARAPGVRTKKTFKPIPRDCWPYAVRARCVGIAFVCTYK